MQYRLGNAGTEILGNTGTENLCPHPDYLRGHKFSVPAFPKISVPCALTPFLCDLSL